MSEQAKGQRPTMIIVLTGVGWLVLGVAAGLLLNNWITGLLVALVLWGVSAPIVVRAVRNSHAQKMAAAEEYITRQPAQVGAAADGAGLHSAGSPSARAYGVPRARSTNVFAILALIFGLIGGILAIPFGHIARSQIRRTREGGAGMALAGLILGYLWLLSILAVIVTVVIAASHR